MPSTTSVCSDMSTGPSTTLALAEATRSKRADNGKKKLGRQAQGALLGKGCSDERGGAAGCNGHKNPLVFRTPAARPTSVFPILSSVLSGKRICRQAREHTGTGTPCHSISTPTSSPPMARRLPVAEGIARLTVNNPSPFTFHGTNSYIIGKDTLAVIDPGPEDEAHLDALIRAIAGRPVSHIFVSHTHRDHSPLAARLKALTGAVIVRRRTAPLGAAVAHRRSQPARRQRRHGFRAGPDRCRRRGRRGRRMAHRARC